MADPLVSVCIPAYNRPEGLARTLEHIRGQTWPTLEILVSDDASEDKGVEEAALAARAADPRVHYFRQPRNLGIIENHAFLRGKVHGRYLMWACDDDWWHPRFIEDCVRALESDPGLVLCMTNSTMVLHGRFYPLSEQVDTGGVEAPEERLLRVLENVRWSNHAFYGVMRTAQALRIPLRPCLAFDVAFVCELALCGHFRQLPQFYFRKSLGGTGMRLATNLAAIKVDDPASRLAPGLRFGTLLAEAAAERLGLGLLDRLRLSARVLLLAWRKDPFPGERRNLLNRLREAPRKLDDWIRYRSARGRIGTHDLTMRLLALQVAPDEVRYDPAAEELELRQLAVTLKVPAQLDLLEGYRELLGLMYQHDLRVFQIRDGRVLIGLDGTSVFYTAANMLYVFREVFIKRCYHVDVAAPTVVFDVGLNLGFTSLYFSRMRLVEKVFGFELFPGTLRLAEENLRLNRSSDKIVTHGFGLLDREETRTMPYSRAFNSMNGLKGVNQGFFGIADAAMERETVRFRPAREVLEPLLDAYPEHRKILKVDVEGSEYRIFENLDEGSLLARFDVVMVEWHDRGPDELEERLRRQGFRLLSTASAHPFSSFETGMIYAFR